MNNLALIQESLDAADRRTVDDMSYNQRRVMLRMMNAARNSALDAAIAKLQELMPDCQSVAQQTWNVNQLRTLKRTEAPNEQAADEKRD